MKSPLKNIFSKLDEHWSSQPVNQICKAIVTHIIDTPNDQLRMLTYSALANLSNCRNTDLELQKAIAILTNTSIHALELKFLFIDRETEVLVEPKEVSIAEEHGEFIHPETGMPVGEYKSKLFPFFVPTKEILSIK